MSVLGGVLGIYVATAAMPSISSRSELGIAVPKFRATALSGERRTERDVVGQDTVLVITPTKGAAHECKLWGETLERKLPSRIALWALLALERPFFVPEKFFLRKAQEKVPESLWGRTWLLMHGTIEKQLGVPEEAEEPYVFAFSSEGRIVARTQGRVTDEKIDGIARALRCHAPAAQFTQDMPAR